MGGRKKEEYKMENEITVTPEYYCHDEYETYVVCPFCQYESRNPGLLHPEDGESFQCGYCDKHFTFGAEYLIKEPK
jgi:transcription elongation factor Elf1